MFSIFVVIFLIIYYLYKGCVLREGVGAEENEGERDKNNRQNLEEDLHTNSKAYDDNGSPTPSPPGKWCPAGKYASSPGVRTSSAECDDCDDGKISKKGSITCTMCPPETIPNNTKTACAPCVGMWEAGECKPCEEDTHWWDGTNCTPYSKGDGVTVNDISDSDSTTSDKQYECKDGYHSLTKNTPSNVWSCSEDCQAGYTGRGSECVKCGSGTFKNSVGIKACTPCPSGQYQNKKGQVGCTPCPSGQYQSKKGQVGCTPCPSGQYQSMKGQVGCTPCPSGQYQSKKGQVGCMTCGQREFSTPDATNCTDSKPIPITDGNDETTWYTVVEYWENNIRSCAELNPAVEGASVGAPSTAAPPAGWWEDIKTSSTCASTIKKFHAAAAVTAACDAATPAALRAAKAACDAAVGAWVKAFSSSAGPPPLAAVKVACDRLSALRAALRAACNAARVDGVLSPAYYRHGLGVDGMYDTQFCRQYDPGAQYRYFGNPAYPKEFRWKFRNVFKDCGVDGQFFRNVNSTSLKKGCSWSNNKREIVFNTAPQGGSGSDHNLLCKWRTA
jgi:hypothetical protein